MVLFGTVLFFSLGVSWGRVGNNLFSITTTRATNFDGFLNERLEGLLLCALN